MKETEKQVNDSYKSLMTQSNNNLARMMNEGAASRERSRISKATMKMFKEGVITKDQLKMVSSMIKSDKSYDDVMNSLKPTEEPKKRGRPAKSKPSSAPIEMDRNEYAHARIRKDDEYMTIIKDLWHKQIITTSKMNSMMGDLEDNKYDKLEKSLSEYTKAKPVLQIPAQEPAPAPKKKRGRPPKPVDTTEIKNLMNEINEHKKYETSSHQDFPKFPKSRKPAKPVKEPRTEIKSLKNNIKNKAKRMMSYIEHSDLMKYISQF